MKFGARLLDYKITFLSIDMEEGILGKVKKHVCSR